MTKVWQRRPTAVERALPGNRQPKSVSSVKLFDTACLCEHTASANQVVVDRRSVAEKRALLLAADAIWCSVSQRASKTVDTNEMSAVCRT